MMSTTLNPSNFLKTSIDIVESYGFKPAESAGKDTNVAKRSKHLYGQASAKSRKLDSLYGILAGGFNTYASYHLNTLEKPVLIYTIETIPRTGEPALALHVFHVDKSVAEAILLQVSRAVASDMGYLENSVRINSMGDQDSMTRYLRELTNFMRKRAHELPEEARELMKDHVYDAFRYLIEKDGDLASRSPETLEYLSDVSRKHFREIVEYLDMSETPYEIDSHLVGHPDIYSGTVFALDLEPIGDGDKLYVDIRGGRYDNFMQQQTQADISAAGAVITLKGARTPKTSIKPKTPKDPKVYLAHLGFGPKVKCLMLTDSLRKSNIMFCHNLASDSLSEQLQEAEDCAVDYVVIMGQKEYVEDAVLLRDMKGKNQEYLYQNDLLKKLQKLYKTA